MAHGKVDVQRSAAGTVERLEIAQSLRVFQDSERIWFAGNRQVRRRFGRDDQEDAGIGASLVELTGGVEITRSVAQRRGAPRLQCYAVSEVFEDAGKPLVSGRKEGQQREVIRRLHQSKKGSRIFSVLTRGSAQRDPHALDRRIGFRHGKATLCRVYVEQRASGVLRLLHVRLVKGIDAEQEAGGCRRELPAEELAAETCGVENDLWMV
jgi:hypothetical protein